MSDLTATNRTHFNNVASTHHTDFGPLIEMIMEEIKDGALLPSITQAIGLDLSENMVVEYNSWARVHGYPEKMRAYRLDLLDPPA
ncbi:hypothetical protein CNMCM7927_005100 [Aspergillus lentulus]|nr:hypothetical protein CNMCM7927_005100 [Aspergillus lentulus]